MRPSLHLQPLDLPGQLDVALALYQLALFGAGHRSFPQLTEGHVDVAPCCPDRVTSDAILSTTFCHYLLRRLQDPMVRVAR